MIIMRPILLFKDSLVDNIKNTISILDGFPFHYAHA